MGRSRFKRGGAYSPGTRQRSGKGRSIRSMRSRYATLADAVEHAAVVVFGVSNMCTLIPLFYAIMS